MKYDKSGNRKSSGAKMVKRNINKGTAKSRVTTFWITDIKTGYTKESAKKTAQCKRLLARETRLFVKNLTKEEIIDLFY